LVDLFTTNPRPGELLTSISVPTYGAGTGGAYLKHRHPASNYAVVGVAAPVELNASGEFRVHLATVMAKRAPAAAAEKAQG
jgi:carbon-monoxide dehydrogenase medium subunit